MGLLAVFANAEEDQMVGEDREVVLLPDGVEKFFDFSVPYCHHLPAFLADQVMVHPIGQ